MLIEKKSVLTGKTHILDIPVTKEQLTQWQEGALIQDAMPNLSVNDREFLISGITPEEWKEVFGE